MEILGQGSHGGMTITKCKNPVEIIRCIYSNFSYIRIQLYQIRKEIQSHLARNMVKATVMEDWRPSIKYPSTVHVRSKILVEAEEFEPPEHNTPIIKPEEEEEEETT